MRFAPRLRDVRRFAAALHAIILIAIAMSIVGPDTIPRPGTGFSLMVGFLAFLGVAWTGALAARTSGGLAAMAALHGFLAGATEVATVLSASREGSLADFGANLAGLICGWALALVVVVAIEDRAGRIDSAGLAARPRTPLIAESIEARIEGHSRMRHPDRNDRATGPRGLD